MFIYRKWSEGTLQVCELSDGQGTKARFGPARGGILTEFLVKGIPLLYLDRETLLDPNKNVRGGNPVLFPICGPLEDGRYTLDGRQYEMKQHGLARNMRWEVADVACSEASARITLKTASDAQTREAYPFDFSLSFTYLIEAGRITIEQRYLNNSPADMPFYAGFHPYFYAPGAKAVYLNIPSGSCYDIKSGLTVEYNGKLNLNAQPETNLVFTDLCENRVSFDRTDGYRVTVKFDDSFRYIVLWNLQNKEFLCVEPWMGSNYDLNKEKARILKPGEELSAVVSYSLSKSINWKTA
ncbi:MAG: aldose epimerase family protein [Eubacteriales bacterium]